ncbi:MAG TPA: SH3 domain-containing protein [Erysipelothrix sp.]|nr:SH3 domain-containing protein [Erysipelothrix sp.]
MKLKQEYKIYSIYKGNNHHSPFSQRLRGFSLSGFLVMLMMILLTTNTQVLAQEITPQVVKPCELKYSVDIIKSASEYETLGCFNTYKEAETLFDEKVKAGTADIVIRFKDDKSVSKIIEMDYGYAVTSTYPLSNLYRNYNRTGTNGNAATYVEQYSKMIYLSTEFNESNVMVHKVAVGGFVGYVHANEVTLVPWKFVTEKYPFTLRDGKIITSTEPNKYIVKSDNSGNREMYYYSGVVYSRYSGVVQNSLIGPFGLAPSWLANGEYYSADGITFYSDFQMKKPVGNGNKYYNYFQYLPLRSRSNLTGVQFDEFLKSRNVTHSIYYGKSNEFVNNQNKYGMNALLVFALANHESAFGTSEIARAKYNVFGWGAIDSDPMGGAGSFSSVEHSIREHMSMNLFGYSNINDWRFTSPALGIKISGHNTKYASDPDWGVKIAQHAYLVDKMFGFKDYNYYGLGVLSDLENINVRSSASTSAGIHYMIPGANNGLLNQTIAITRQVGEFYESTSWFPIIDGKPLTHSNDGYYLNNVDTSLGYIHGSLVSLLNTSKWSALPGGTLPKSQLVTPPPPPPPPPAPEPHNFQVNSPEGLIVRSAPSTSGDRLGVLLDKTTFYGIPEADGQWIKLTYQQKTGYVFAQYTTPYSTTGSFDIQAASGYKLVNSTLTGMNISTTISALETKLKAVDSGVSITVVNSSGTAKDKSAVLATGDKLTVNQPNKPAVAYTIAVKGDINGDGKITASDFTHIQRHLMNVVHLTGEKFVAADINSSQSITASDFTHVQRHLMGISKLHE